MGDDLMEDDLSDISLDPIVVKALEAFVYRFGDKLKEVVNVVSSYAQTHYVQYIVVFGSFLTGLRERSDIDLLVLLKDGYREAGFKAQRIQWDLEDLVEEIEPRDIKIDWEVTSMSSFRDMSVNRAFKENVLRDNVIVWEADNL